jgi:hypothetical protein
MVDEYQRSAKRVAAVLPLIKNKQGTHCQYFIVAAYKYFRWCSVRNEGSR